MAFKHKSRAAKIILLCLSLSVIEKGWVTKTHPFELGALVITQEALYALTLGCSMLWRACTNSNNSAVDRVLQEEINKNNSPEVSPKISARAPQQVSAQVAAVDHIKQVPIIRVSSASVKKADNLANKARAVVSHVTHEQIVQTAYAAIPETEKLASQELLHHVAINWHKEIANRCDQDIRSAQAQAYNHMFTQLQTCNPRATWELHPNGGATLHTPNSRGSLYLGPSRQRPTHSLADDIVEQRLQEQIQIKYNPYVRAAIEHELCGFLNNAHYLVYGTLLERIAALIYLGDFHIGFRTFGQELCDVQKQIYAHYVHTDGSICIDRLSDMTNAHTIIKKYVVRHKKVVSLFERSCERSRSSCNQQLIKKEKNADLNAIRNNRTNQCYRNMLAAFASGDMQQVEQIKNGNSGIQGIHTLHGQIRTAYDTCIAQQEALSKDAYGLLNFNLPIELQDPVYTILSDHDRTRLQNNPSALASFNDTLKLRQLYKKALHKAWNISWQADPVVHQALYALIDSGTIPDRIDKIHKVSINPSITTCERKKIVQAFFLSNGIMKDFTEYDRAKSLKMPAAILEEKHAHTRLLLNRLVYAERVCTDEQIKSDCAAAIEFIEYAVAIDDEESPELYLSYAQDVYKQIIATNMLFNEQQPTDNQQNNNQLPSDPSKKPNKNKKNQKPPANTGGPLLQKMTAEQWKKTLQYCTDPNNLNHWFGKNTIKHNFGQLLAKMNNNEIAVVEAILAQCIGKLPQDGFFEDIPIDVEGFIVTVAGVVMEGVIKFGTIFIK
jgi:hypothetical protein